MRLGGRTTPLPGVRVRQCRNFDEVVQANASPPRVRYDDAILLLADRATRELDRIAILADACGGRRMFRDVVDGGQRPPWRQIVELDGRLGHDSAVDRDRDLERDLDAALGNTGTVRLG